MEENLESWIQEHEAPSRHWAHSLLLVVVGLSLVLSLLINLLGLTNMVKVQPDVGDEVVGITEAQVIERFGRPDFRSPLQRFVSGEGFGMLPRGLKDGEEFFYLNITIHGIPYVFHLVSPETLLTHTGLAVAGEDWVVLEFHRGARFELY